MKLDETPGYAFCRIARKVHYQIDLIFKEEGMTVEQWVALKTISENQPLIQKELGAPHRKDAEHGEIPGRAP